MTQRILVIGATGLLGGAVARSLQDAGFRVRVMSRHANRARPKFPEPFEVVEGDALNRADVEKALTSCDAVHISIEHDQEDECITQVVQAAQRQGLKRITYVSGTTVCEENRWFPLVDHKLKSEQTIRASGIEYTIFCPGWFMEMLPRFVESPPRFFMRHGRALIFGKPARRWHFVALQDFARMVAESYRRPEAVNKRFYVHGPQAFTSLEAVQAYCRALHPEIKKFLHIPYWLGRLSGWIRGRADLRFAMRLLPYLEQVGERGDPTDANAILGAPQTTLDQWLQMQKTPGSGTAPDAARQLAFRTGESPALSHSVSDSVHARHPTRETDR
jgi:uncharacterized protein YbjT (DUF2867 family)